MRWLSFVLLLLSASLTAQSQTFLLDFGPNDGSNGNETISPDINGQIWVNVTNPSTAAPPVSLLNQSSEDNGLTVAVTSSFSTNGINHGGLLAPANDLLGLLAIPTATQDYFFTNSSASLRFSGLDPSKSYVFTLFASRNNTQVRTSGYLFSGANQVEGSLQSSGPDLGGGGYNGNNSTLYTSEAVLPNADGDITLLVDRDAGQFAYINFMRIEEVSGNNQIEVTGIEVLGDDITVQGETRQMEAVISPADATVQAVSWSVDNPTIAEITPAGEVIPLKNGTVTVTATSLEPESTFSNNKQLIISNQTINHFFIDLGIEASQTASPDVNGNTWNNATDSNLDATPLLLQTSTGQPSGYTLVVTDEAVVGGNDDTGLLNPQGELLGELALATATTDYFRTSNESAITFRNLNPEAAYQIRAFGAGTHTGTRETTYIVEGFNASQGTVQTSGPDLSDFNLNDDDIFLSERVFPSDSGTITLTFDVSLGRFGYLNALRLTEYPGVELCPEEDRYGIAVMGSSVARGQGAPNDMGYAYQFNQLLQARTQGQASPPFEISNISVGGNNTTAVASRWASDLAPLCDKYVVYGLSLANEGIRNGGQPVFDQFRDNMLDLIDRARARDIIPVVVGNYSRRDFNATDYAFIRDMNLLIHEWDVPSINVLGTNDNGSGNWVAGYEADLGHPNTVGHTEFFYAFVPSLFDALDAGKPLPVSGADNGVSIGSAVDVNPITFSPDNGVHAYTLTFSFRTAGTGELAELTDAMNDVAQLTVSSDGNLRYTSPEGASIVSTVTVNDNGWHTLSLTHYYARGTTELYLDGSKVSGNINEQRAVTSVALAGNAAPANLDLRQLYFHRSGMNQDELTALSSGILLKSSLEVYAPLDSLANDILENRAQSTVVLSNPQLSSLNRQLPLSAQAFSFSPNPVEGILRIERRDGVAVESAEVYDVNGRLVRTFSSGVNQVNLTGTAPGIYVVRAIGTDSKAGTFRIVVQ